MKGAHDHLWEILNYANGIMGINNLVKFCGNFGTVLVIIAAIFKIQHYPFQNELMAIGMLSFGVFWIWTLVKIFMIEQPLTYKTVWTIIVMFIPIVGSWIYYHFQFKK